MIKYSLKIAFIMATVLFSCDASNRKTADTFFLIPAQTGGSYDLKNPVEKYFLPYVLEEISGLSFVGGGHIACVQDEDGKVFFYDINKREITRSVKFSKSGDYEGVEMVNDTLYVVSSNGDIFQFDSRVKNPEVKTYKTALRKSNDIEGLGYDPETNNLLLVCKDNSDIDKKEIKGKAVYQFDLQEKRLKTKPAFSITKSDMKSFFEANKNNIYEEKRLNFRPSGIALHPIQNKYYIIASVGKMLLVVNRNGEIEASYPIAPRLLGQPEGICFAPNGDMYISSEGEGDKGYILMFEMK